MNPPLRFPVVVQVARKFYDDHEGRDCGLTDQVIKRNANTVTVRLDEEGWDDLLSDAKHYGYGGIDWGETDSWTRSIEASARAVYDRMKRTQAKSSISPTATATKERDE
jgi:hypothetical protein